MDNLLWYKSIAKGPAAETAEKLDWTSRGRSWGVCLYTEKKHRVKYRSDGPRYGSVGKTATLVETETILNRTFSFSENGNLVAFDHTFLLLSA